LHYWQVLPLNPTTPGADESPYFSSSSRAGNPLFISLEDLAGEGLLEAEELAAPAEASETGDFAYARRFKQPLLALAARRVVSRNAPGFLAFCQQHADWLDDHALFTSLSAGLGLRWRDWPEALKRRDAEALAAAAAELSDRIHEEKALQYLFSCQWQVLRETCESCRVSLFGDMPIYVNTDSVDVWASPGVYQLDDALNPSLESGVPPDYFSTTGQLWRNPVYNWAQLQADGFNWWIQRLRTLLARLDLLRIDHFRGLAQYWAVEAGAETAEHGRWLDVPSEAFFNALRAAIEPLPLVAEDLGTITPDVIALRDHYGLPGMIVLHFAFYDDNHDNPYKPENHRENAVAYLGTHDNNTTLAWLDGELDDAARGRLSRYVACQNGEDGVLAMTELLLSSRARLAIVCAQDLLKLPGNARMNTPGMTPGNWRWRLTPAQFNALPLDWLGQQCRRHGR